MPILIQNLYFSCFSEHKYKKFYYFLFNNKNIDFSSFYAKIIFYCRSHLCRIEQTEFRVHCLKHYKIITSMGSYRIYGEVVVVQKFVKDLCNFEPRMNLRKKVDNENLRQRKKLDERKSKPKVCVASLPRRSLKRCRSFKTENSILDSTKISQAGKNKILIEIPKNKVHNINFNDKSKDLDVCMPKNKECDETLSISETTNIAEQDSGTTDEAIQKTKTKLSRSNKIARQNEDLNGKRSLRCEIFLNNIKQFESYQSNKTKLDEEPNLKSIELNTIKANSKEFRLSKNHDGKHLKTKRKNLETADFSNDTSLFEDNRHSAPDERENRGKATSSSGRNIVLRRSKTSGNSQDSNLPNKFHSGKSNSTSKVKPCKSLQKLTQNNRSESCKIFEAAYDLNDKNNTFYNDLKLIENTIHKIISKCKAQDVDYNKLDSFNNHTFYSDLISIKDIISLIESKFKDNEIDQDSFDTSNKYRLKSEDHEAAQSSFDPVYNSSHKPINLHICRKTLEISSSSEFFESTEISPTPNANCSFVIKHLESNDDVLFSQDDAIVNFPGTKDNESMLQIDLPRDSLDEDYWNKTKLNCSFELDDHDSSLLLNRCHSEVSVPKITGSLDIDSFCLPENNNAIAAKNDFSTMQRNSGEITESMVNNKNSENTNQDNLERMRENSFTVKVRLSIPRKMVPFEKSHGDVIKHKDILETDGINSFCLSQNISSLVERKLNLQEYCSNGSACNDNSIIKLKRPKYALDLNDNMNASAGLCSSKNDKNLFFKHDADEADQNRSFETQFNGYIVNETFVELPIKFSQEETNSFTGKQSALDVHPESSYFKNGFINNPHVENSQIYVEPAQSQDKNLFSNDSASLCGAKNILDPTFDGFKAENIGNKCDLSSSVIISDKDSAISFPDRAMDVIRNVHTNIETDTDLQFSGEHYNPSEKTFVNDSTKLHQKDLENKSDYSRNISKSVKEARRHSLLPVFSKKNSKMLVMRNFDFYNDLIVAESSIHGYGVFTPFEIPENTLLMEYKGEIIGKCMSDKREQLYKRNNIDSVYMFSISEDMIIDATLTGNKARYVNHSCNPNCEAILSYKDRSIKYCTIRNVAANEELLINYNMGFDMNAETCNCNDSGCKFKQII